MIITEDKIMKENVRHREKTQGTIMWMIRTPGEKIGQVGRRNNKTNNKVVFLLSEERSESAY